MILKKNSPKYFYVNILSLIQFFWGLLRIFYRELLLENISSSSLSSVKLIILKNFLPRTRILKMDIKDLY
jgi:hypothetical protein